MQQYTAYRPSCSFMDSLNRNKQNLELHRRKNTFTLSNEAEVLHDVVDALNTMLKAGYLLPAATVKADSDDAFFRLTNTITKNWTENDEVTVLDNDSDVFFNSSSSGDIFCDEQGQFYLICSFGFAALKTVTTLPLTLSLP